jgi:hypothetical protein
MANSKISALPSATTPLAGTEVLPVVQGGITEQVSVANLTAGRDVSASGLFVDANSATAAVRITQLGAGNSLLVEDSTNPDSTPFVIDGSGVVVAGYTVNPGVGQKFNLVGNGTDMNLALSRYQNITGGSTIYQYKARGSASAPTIVQSGDTLGAKQFVGYDGTSFIVGAQIVAAVDGTPGTNDMPGRLVFSTTADGASTPTERLRITSAGNINVTTGNLVISTSGKGIDFTAGGVANGVAYLDGSKLLASFSSNFKFDGTTLDLGAVGSNGRLTVKAPSGQRAVLCYNSAGSAYFYTDNDNAVSTGANAADAVLFINKITSNNRSINAAGTLNASGADYAEYMTKAGDFVIAKGDVCGVDANGKLTNVFANSISFIVKSSDPSFVGGDTWGANLEGDVLKAARQKVDRVAFAGQVPVNILGAVPGQYIVPVNDGGAIKPTAVDESNMTLAMYMKAVGKVIATEPDGRAKIIVKTA